MRSNHHSSLSLLLFALYALAVPACQQMEDGVYHESGAIISNDWVLTAPIKENEFTQANGTQYRTFVYNLSYAAPFAAYCGQEVHFSPACAIKRSDYAGGTAYDLEDYSPLPGGVIDAYSVPVHKGKLLAVRGRITEQAPEGSDTFTRTRCMIEALIEVQHPDTSVNQGKPLYLVYNLGQEGSKEAAASNVYTDIKRAPWEPASTPQTRSISSLLEQVVPPFPSEAEQE